MPRPRGAWTALLVSALVAVSACDASSAEPPPIPAGTPVPVAPAAVPAPAHVVVVVFENEDAEAVIGSPDASYLTSLSELRDISGVYVALSDVLVRYFGFELDPFSLQYPVDERLDGAQGRCSHHDVVTPSHDLIDG